MLVFIERGQDSTSLTRSCKYSHSRYIVTWDESQVHGSIRSLRAVVDRENGVWKVHARFLPKGLFMEPSARCLPHLLCSQVSMFWLASGCIRIHYPNFDSKDVVPKLGAPSRGAERPRSQEHSLDAISLVMLKAHRVRILPSSEP